METANITYLDEEGRIKVKIDPEKCINCGRCITMCTHEVRYYEDDTMRFLDDLATGMQISLIVAPSIKTNIPEYKRLFSHLKNLGVNKIYDVSFGADISIWAHVRHLEQNEYKPMITQPCPVIVSYCETYRHELIGNLAPLQSPMACTAIYMKEYESIGDSIAALSPCIAKSVEFEETGLVQYNVTFSKLLEYLLENGIELPMEETDFDSIESGLGSIFPMPGGLKENIEFYFGNEFHISKSEGFGVFNKLDTYALTPWEFLPALFDCLNCQEGCNIGPAVHQEQNPFQVESLMIKQKNEKSDEQWREHLRQQYARFDEKLQLSSFLRNYNKIEYTHKNITDAEIEDAFLQLGKNNYDKQHVDCGACGSATCYDMARKIALGVNIVSNCMVLVMETAKDEHEQFLAAHEQINRMEKLREADEHIRVLLDANPHISVLFNDKFQVLDCNLAALNFMGFATKQDLIDGFLERTLNSIPEYQSSGRISIPLSERFQAVINEGFVSFETDLVVDGEVRTLDVNFKKIPYGESFAIVGYFYDMTSIHEREMELKRVQGLNELQLAKLNLAVHATNLGLWDLDVVADDPLGADNQINWAVESLQLLGYGDLSSFPNTIGKWKDILHPEDKERVIDAFSKHILDSTGRTPYDIEHRMQKRNGEFAYYRVTGATIRDEMGTALRVSGALMDITESKELLLEAQRQRLEAEAANKAKSAFLSTMSHEIRTPMNAILGITEVQLQNSSHDEETRDALGKIYTSGDMLLGIINDILDLSKIESGKLELVLDKYEVASLVSDSAQLNMMRIGSKPIEFEIDIDENLPTVLQGDELRVKQILNNILSNAFKYTEAGTVTLSITLEAMNKDDLDEDCVPLLIVISDTGQGMSEDQVAKLFDEYSRFNADANRSTEGTGLGMSITQKLIDMMDGQIRVESEVNVGTTVYVHIPQRRVGPGVLGKEMVENLQKFRTSSRSQNRLARITREPMPYGSVLIVDDVDTNIYVARGLLSPYDLHIDHADSGFTAIEKVKAGNVYDIIFMDHMMPQMDGLEATKLIRDMGYTHPIVALTANAVSGQSDMFINNGFDDFIAKPIDVRQLNTILNRLIRDKQDANTIYEARQQASNATNTSPEPVSKVAISPRFAEIFIRDAVKTLDILEAYMEKDTGHSDDDVRAYTISIHGIKSALASIGRTDLSEVALNLEIAIRNNDIHTVSTETQSFIDRLRGLVEELSPKEDVLDESIGDKLDEESENLEELHECLFGILEACQKYDESSIEEIINLLSDKPLNKSTNELLAAISTHLLHSDFDEIVELITAYMTAAS
ncbi:MAG: ATP-binding protein [Oscillospiraceae bacterium]|nr:ATP-binding protein [Oscillospiraceae bacterium]